MNQRIFVADDIFQLSGVENDVISVDFVGFAVGFVTGTGVIGIIVNVCAVQIIITGASFPGVISGHGIFFPAAKHSFRFYAEKYFGFEF